VILSIGSGPGGRRFNFFRPDHSNLRYNCLLPFSFQNMSRLVRFPRFPGSGNGSSGICDKRNRPGCSIGDTGLWFVFVRRVSPPLRLPIQEASHG
jgi:hypothetical protein